MPDNYYFFDGSALCAQIRTLWKRDRTFAGRKLDPVRFVKYFQDRLLDLGSGSYKRATFYFPKDDDGPSNHLMMPDFRTPGLIRDLHFKYCGEKLRGAKAFTKWAEDKVPPRWRDRVSKSEKGIDIEICCDALKLVSASRLDRLFLFTNDADFVPLCRTLKELGSNVSLLHLTEKLTSPNLALLAETDSFDVVPLERLKSMFFPVPPPPQ